MNAGYVYMDEKNIVRKFLCGIRATSPGRGLIKSNLRLAANSGEKNFFHRKVPASFSVECGKFLYDLRLLAVKFFSPHSSDCLQKRN